MVIDRDGHSEVHLGWGSGVAAVKFASFPARVIVDVFQEPTPAGEVAGPIAVGEGFGPILFEPVSRQLTGGGVTGPITVRGWSRGFEAVSVLDVRRWSGTIVDHPGSWTGRLFGEPELSPPAPRPAGLVLDPPAPEWADPDASTIPFSTPGYFEFTLSGLTPGAYQLAVTPSTGLGCASSVGQQFRVAGGAPVEAGAAPMVPFSLTRGFVDEAQDELRAITVVDVLGVAYVVDGVC
jgi:hypothetical protein